MKIDPRIQSLNDPSTQQVKNTRTGAPSSKSASSSSGLTSSSGEDTVRLSSAHGEVQMLAAGLAQVPEVRSGLVQALQAKIRDGSYQPDSGEVADSIIKDHAGINAKA